MTEQSIDLVPNLVRRRKSNGRSVYNAEAKRELVRRCVQPGVSLAATAMAHGVNANLVRKWVVMQRGRSKTMAPAVKLLAVASVPASAPTVPTSSALPPVPGAWKLELVVPGGTIRIRGRVDAEMLRTVLSCLAARA